MSFSFVTLRLYIQVKIRKSENLKERTMIQKNLRTYRRRNVTRESGYHTCESTTGGECRIETA